MKRATRATIVQQRVALLTFEDLAEAVVLLILVGVGLAIGTSHGT